jgi:ribonuclease HI
MALTAKFATTCGVCSRPIAPGEEIRSFAGPGKGRWAHEECQPALDLDPAADQDLLLSGAGPQSPAASATTSTVGTDAATQVWTDGACSGNPGPGGWAWATADGREGYGSSPATTNQRMEIQAALEAVRALSGPVIVVSDSTYVVNCFKNGWWRAWLAKGWVNSAKKPVANRDLWEPLITAVRDRGDVTFRWVKGHSGDVMNDRVDELAVRAGKEQSHS